MLKEDYMISAMRETRKNNPLIKMEFTVYMEYHGIWLILYE